MNVMIQDAPQVQLPLTPAKVAYFCMEFALANDFAIYSGGLGVLAGDYLYEAAQRKAPVIGMGLFYSFSYTQQLDENGMQIEHHAPLSGEEADVSLITDHQGAPITVTVLIQDREVQVQAWLKKIQDLQLILLDTNIEANSTVDRHITDQLYAGDKEHRLSQEIILGIGGVKMLHRLNMFPEIYHSNEGHATFLIFQQTAHLMKAKQLPFLQALEETRTQTVFTNHTLVPAGNDIFPFDLLMIYLEKYAQQIGVPIHQLLELGKVTDSTMFSMTLLGLRHTKVTNAVSTLHAQEALNVWPNNPMIPITNGIYLPRWQSKEQSQFWPLDADQPGSQENIWHAHQEDKRDLVAFVKKRTGVQISDQALIFSWARRFVQYKRPLALFWQLEWLEHIIKASPVPVHFLFAGKVHPHDTEGKEAIAKVVEISKDPRFTGHVTFIPNYNLEVAEYLTRGSDVWLNTPMEGFEACGTSGMKASLNGVLQCTTSDGWTREVQWHDIGWILDDQQISESLYKTIEKEIIPLFAQRGSDGIPRQWIERMITTSQIIRDQYSTKRMFDQYWSQLYALPELS